MLLNRFVFSELFIIENLPTFVAARDKCYKDTATCWLRTRISLESSNQSEKSSRNFTNEIIFNGLCNETFHRDERFIKCKNGLAAVDV